MTVRNPDRTRESIVQAAFDDIYSKGFHAASINNIIKNAGATKGALYHHFASKNELGYAVIDDVIRPLVKERWLDPLEQLEDPIDALINCLEKVFDSLPPEARLHGCPLANLTHEMSAVDEGFRLRIQNVLENWQLVVAKTLQRGIEAGTVRADIKPENVACFIVASIEGTIGLEKNTKDSGTFERFIDQLKIYLEALRAKRPHQANQIK